MQISSPYIHPIPGLTCLHIATLQRNQSLMKLLLENGADIDVQVRWPPGLLPVSETVALTFPGTQVQHASSRGPWLTSLFLSRRARVGRQRCTWPWRPRSGVWCTSCSRLGPG